jgi:nucleoside-triphosphatase
MEVSTDVGGALIRRPRGAFAMRPSTTSSESGKTNLLLVGRPGIGKTTALRRAAAALGSRPRGFLTEEIREGGERTGFRLVTFGGATAILAHVGIGSRRRVGRYGVDVAALDRIVAGALHPGEPGPHLVDEIGKMECLSPLFVRTVVRLLEEPVPFVATVARSGGGLIADAKSRADAEVWEVTVPNRDEIPRRVLEWLAARGVG